MGCSPKFTLEFGGRTHQRINRTISYQGTTKDENYRELVMYLLSTALAMTEAAYVEAKRRRDL